MSLSLRSTSRSARTAHVRIPIRIPRIERRRRVPHERRYRFPARAGGESRGVKPLTAGAACRSGGPAQRREERAASERRLGFNVPVLFGKHYGQIGLGKLELRLYLAALGGIASVPELKSQFFDVLFGGHRRHLLAFEKDDTRGRGEGAGSRIAERDRRTARGGAEMRRHFGGNRSSLRLASHHGKVARSELTPLPLVWH